MQRISNQAIQHVIKYPTLKAGQNLGRISAICSAIICSQGRNIMLAVKKESSNLVEKVTGYEPDPDKRKSITDRIKSLGMRWEADEKCWKSKQDIPYETVKAIIDGQNASATPPKDPGATSRPLNSSPSEQSPYTARIDNLLKELDGAFERILPRQINKGKFIESLRLALINAKNVGNISNDESLKAACMKCAELGLTPGSLQECYFSTRENQIEFVLGYKGVLTLARRTYPNLQIETNVVRKGDNFTYVLGTKPHVSLQQMENADPEAIEYAYVMIRFPGGIEKLSIVDVAHINKRKACSKGIHSPTSPWKKFQREMWLKTALREAFRFVNLSPEASPQKDFHQAIQSFKDLVTSLQEELDEVENKKKSTNTSQPA